jgi:hypothetical protein
MELPFSPPTECATCGRVCEPFASREGWLCWECLPLDDRCDESGKEVPEPTLDRHDRADLRRIRERLAPNAERCVVCAERRAQSELFNQGGKWVCADCLRRQRLGSKVA